MLYANSRSNNNNNNNSNGASLGAHLHNFPRASRPTTMGNSLGQPEASTTANRMNRIDGAVRRNRSRIYDDPAVVEGYNSVPLIEMDRLPRGGITLETAAVGRIQFGIPPETIKDSMRLGFEVPSVYIVPVERFCREMGPALGINLAEFEFPAYFNYFCSNKRCTLVVDSVDAEQNIRTVFNETLLGPEQFRNHANPKPNEDEDFGPNFCKEARPNFYKEFKYFRTEDDQRERTIDQLLEFCHFQVSQKRFGATGFNNEKLGVPPIVKGERNDDQIEGNLGFAVPEDSTFDVAMEEENAIEMPGLRRTLSDPDIRSVSIDNIGPAVPPSSGNNDSFPFSTDNITTPRRITRRGSMDSTGSFMSRGGRSSRDGMSWASGASFMLASDDEEDPSKNSWMYSQAKWLGEVATVFPPEATEYEKQLKSCARVEIFKMAGGTEYIVHDVDRNNIIVGKARLSGTVRVPDEMAVEGFLARDPEEDTDSDTDMEDDDEEESDGEGDRESQNLASKSQDVGRRPPPTFHPPSFGVTVLGNSHGFDKNGSVSGYVLWINGRGVMIDPPPYSSATLEREGIRPTMIMAIIITHCHADHDAGSFQKVMTGSRVAIITTPTIYKSFIRKYAALSGLSPHLLKHSHRHRPAIIGEPLKFQGATFRFTYTLHTIPCIAFKVEWRGRSMVFTGDHLNKPTEIDNLERMGVVTPERANDLRELPLQECDVLLHEAGEPPIHTPISVLQEMPEEIKKRLYVVHTSSLDGANDLRVAPTGTAGTIRLDEVRVGRRALMNSTDDGNPPNDIRQRDHHVNHSSLSELVDDEYYNCTSDDPSKILARRLSTCSNENQVEAGTTTPKVFLRRTCVSDAWFILNLLSNVPFLSSLNYSNTMEVLEIAQVEIFSPNKVVIPAARREKVLCVVWEGTCVERGARGELSTGNDSSTTFQHSVPIDVDLEQVVDLSHHDSTLDRTNPTVWHAGDWTGPLALQPDMERSAEKKGNDGPKDIVALSTEGVKVIMLNMKDLQKILKSGSKLFRKYLLLKEKQKAEEDAFRAQIIRDEADHDEVDPYFRQNGNIIDVESVVHQTPNNWYAYDSVLEVLKCNSALRVLSAHQKRHLESLAEGPRYFESNKYLWQVGQPVEYAFLIVAGTANFAQKPEDEVFRNRRGSTGNMGPLPLQPQQQSNRPRLDVPFIEQDKQLFNVPPNSEYARLEIGLQLRVEEMELDVYEQPKDILPKEERVRNTRDRFANKVLARLYSRRAYTDGLVFSRGNLLSDTSRMVSGNLANIHHTGRQESMSSMTHGLAARDHHCHTSNMVAGPEGGCVVMIFPRSTLVSFLDSNPGVLLSLLGTQVVV